MSERERLIELLTEGQPPFNPLNDVCIEKLADHLLANGVLVPPCKVGDTVYEALPRVGHIRSNKVVGFHLGRFTNIRGQKRKEYLICYSDFSLTHIDIDKFGKTVFPAKEEAEQVLKSQFKK
ncbi:MAG: hypothetical protein J6C82_05020 [Clostridia bacterium]|nr:hypothetical protein [Clostridia bacterium]